MSQDFKWDTATGVVTTNVVGNAEISISSYDETRRTLEAAIEQMMQFAHEVQEADRAMGRPVTDKCVLHFHLDFTRDQAGETAPE